MVFCQMLKKPNSWSSSFGVESSSTCEHTAIDGGHKNDTMIDGNFVDLISFVNCLAYRLC